MNLNNGTNKHIEKFIQETRALTPFELDLNIKELDDIKESVKENRGFITDEEAAVLSWSTVTRIVETRTRIDNIINNTKAIMILSRDEESQSEKIRSYEVQLVKKLILLSKNMKPLLEYTTRIRKRSLLSLVFYP